MAGKARQRRRADRRAEIYRARKSAQHMEKRELFRAGLKVLAAIKENEFMAALAAGIRSRPAGRRRKTSNVQARLLNITFAIVSSRVGA